MSTELVFGGSTTTPFGGTAPGQAAPWFQVLEQAFFQLTATPEGRAQYGDPSKGATLAQAWRTAQLLGVPPRVCLLAAGQPRASADGIARVITMSPADLVATLNVLFSREARIATQIFTFDGRTGHSVTLLHADASGFTFHDPWPGDSLLSKHQNAAGIHAQHDGQRWRLTSAELETVIVAAFVPPLAWAELSGQAGRVRYQDLQASDFWRFFHIRETGRAEAEPGVPVVQLRTGGFAEHLSLTVRLSKQDSIDAAELRIRGAWLAGAGAPLAADLAGNFLKAMAPSVDRAQVEPIARAILEHLHPAGSEVRQPMAGSIVSIDTAMLDGAPWRSLRIDCL